MEFLTAGLQQQMGNIPIGFLPSQVPGLKVWPRFNSGITVTGSGVSQWDDQSGNGNHLKQGTDADRPSKEADGSILCDGISQFLKTDAFTLVQPETIFLLFKQVTWTLDDFISDGNAGSSGAIYQNSSTPLIRVFAGSVSSTNSNLALDTYGILSLVINGASSSLQINNTTPVTGDFGANDLGGFTLGAHGSGSSSSNIQVKEALVYSTDPDATSKAQIKNYLARVGGLSI